MKHLLLSQATIIGIDSMCFIYQLEGNPYYGPLVQSLFSQITQGILKAVTSIITITETLTVSRIAQTPDLRALYITKLTQIKNLTLVPIDLMLAEQAAVLRNYYNIKLGDALQIATARMYNADLFITNDKKLKRVTQPTAILLDELLA